MDSFLISFVRWDNEPEFDRMSPWDLEPIDEDRRPTEAGVGVPVLPEEIASTLYRPRAEDWLEDDRDSECDRISAGLSQVMRLHKAKHFAAPVNQYLNPSYETIVEYLMDLSTIKARLDNRFYRRASAVKFDVSYIVINACKFFGPQSDFVRSASIITDFCLEIIRNRDAVDVKTAYQELAAKFRDEGTDSSGPSSAEATPNTSSASKHSESEEDSSKSNGVDTSKSKVNC